MTKAAICRIGDAATATTKAAAKTKAVMVSGEGRVAVMSGLQGLFDDPS